MSQVHDLIREKVEERGLDLKQLSLGMGKNHAYLHQYLNRGSPKKLDEDGRAYLARALGVSESDLREKPEIKEQMRGIGLSPKFSATSQPKHVTNGSSTERMKVLGMGEGGSQGWNPFNGEIVQYIDVPVNLKGIKDAYGVYVKGDSMAPRYEEGMIVHLHPFKRVQAGDYVLVQRKPLEDGDAPLAIIKRLVKQTPTKYVLESLSPPGKRYEVPAEEVVSIHRIVGTTET
jgi:phage repressor protein C with HTH and peptisase S24 domain